MLPLTALLASAETLKRISPLLSHGEGMLLGRIAEALLEEAVGEEADSLAQKFLSFGKMCEPDDLRRLREALNLAAGSLAAQIASGEQSRLTVSAFQSIARYFNPEGSEQQLWRGSLKANFPGLFESIRNEAEVTRLSGARRNYARVGPPGQYASMWVNSEFLRGELLNAGLRVRPSGKATYVYYESKGDHVRPHVDIEEFAFNVLLLIAHEAEIAKQSKLLLFRADATFITIDLVPGDFLVFDAGRTFHARQPVGDGETVAILTAGLIPQPTS